MHFVQADLNLLVALDALLTEGSVGGAADRLHLSQPAMSRALGRLRRATGDDILVRAGHTMVPTPYAQHVRGEVRALVERTRAVLSPSVEFDPAHVQRVFTLRVNDALAAATLPHLARAVRDEAPGVTIRVLGEGAESPASLRTDEEVDAHLGDDVPSAPDLRHRRLGTSGLALLGAGPGESPTLDEFAALGHVVVSRRGRTRDRIDDLLAEHGLRRRVVLTVATLDAAVATIAGTDLVTVAPAAGLQRFEPFGLHARPLPFPTEPLGAVLVWHARLDRDPAHAWFRDHIAAAVEAALASSSTR